MRVRSIVQNTIKTQTLLCIMSARRAAAMNCVQALCQVYLSGTVSSQPFTVLQTTTQQWMIVALNPQEALSGHVTEPATH